MLIDSFVRERNLIEIPWHKGYINSTHKYRLLPTNDSYPLFYEEFLYTELATVPKYSQKPSILGHIWKKKDFSTLNEMVVAM